MKWHLFFANEFLDADVGYIKSKNNKHPFWDKQEQIQKYCKFHSLDAAKEAMNVYLEKLKQEKIQRSYKVIE